MNNLVNPLWTSACLGALFLLPNAVSAQDADAGYVIDNTIAIFHHEFGHALIDYLEIPIFGQEEDAADVLSILMIDSLFEPDVANEIAYNTALTFELDAEENGDEDLAFWDTHGLDLQRYYNLVCLHYGGDVENREEFAQDLGLPQERADSCEEERELAEASWGSVLENLETETGGTSLRFSTEIDNPQGIRADYVTAVQAEVEGLNQWIELPEMLDIVVAVCDEANAFYDPQTRQITMCIEFADHLAKQSAAL